LGTELSTTPAAAALRRPAATAVPRLRAAVRTLRGERLAVVAVLAAFAALLTWNVGRYPSGQSQDAQQHFAYVSAIEHLRLPTDTESKVAHDPPLFYLAAAGIESTWKAVTGAPGGDRITHKVVQLFNALAAITTALLIFLTARELLPRSRITRFTALGVFMLSPVVMRAGVEYYGQMLATLLSVAGLFVLVRALARDQLTIKVGVITGVLLGLASLTRVFELAAVGAAGLALATHFAFTRRREVLAVGAALIVSAGAFSVSWFLYRTASAGSPVALACTSPTDAGCSQGRRESELRRAGPTPTVFNAPYRPLLGNRAAQILYADWWGDYFLYYDVPAQVRQAAIAGTLPHARLPNPYRSERIRQSYVGLVPTLLMLGGLLGLLWEGVRRRRAALLALPAAAALAGLAEVAFWLLFPTADNDTLKAIYILTALPGLAIGVGWVLAQLRRRSRLVFGLAVTALLASAAVDVQFLWLSHSVAKVAG
jgi:hypothetical protein